MGADAPRPSIILIDRHGSKVSRKRSKRLGTFLHPAGDAPVMTSATTADPAPAPSSTTSGSGSPNSNVLAAVAYILTFITGLIIYFVADKNDKYARWHAIQAIGLGIVALVIGIILSFVSLGLLGVVWNVIVLVLVIILAVKAYQGQKIRLPIIADIADKNA